MSEPLVLTTLRTKRADIEKHIEALTARLSDARSDLLHVVAVMRMFDPSTVSYQRRKVLTFRPPVPHPEPARGAVSKDAGSARCCGGRLRPSTRSLRLLLRMRTGKNFQRLVSDRPAKSYTGATSAMKRSDLFELCRVALEASSEPLTTRELAAHVISSQGWDTEDRSLRITVAHRVTTHLGRMSRRGAVVKVGERGGVTLWGLP